MIDQTHLTFLAFVIGIALVFELSNGFNDAANAIATVVSTRVMSPLAAVIMAAIMNFLGAISGTAVAKTVGKGVVDPRDSHRRGWPGSRCRRSDSRCCLGLRCHPARATGKR